MKVFINDEIGTMTSDQIACVELRYRRKNNIFEVGDDIVYTYKSSRYELYVIHGKVVDGMVWIRNHRNQFIHERIEYLEHATDEEIKAGRRL